MIDAYAAGLVDGEGCLSIPLSRGVTPTPRLDMGMGEKALTVLRQMQTEYGGTVRLSRPATGKWQAAWMWSMWGEDLRVSLERWMPHLRLKKDQALLLLRLYEVASLQPKTGKHQMRRVWTAEGIAQGMEIRAAIMSLNRKGPPESGDQTEEIARLVDAQWVTSQRDLFSAGYTRFSGHWPKSGTMRDGIISAQPSAVRPTKEIVSGSSGWTTPPVDDANNVTRASGSQASLARDSYQFGQVEPWGTPNSTDGKGGASTRTSPEDQRGELRHQIGGFGSPIGQTPSPTVEPMAPSDSFQAEQWATPRAGKTTSEDEEVWSKRKAKGEVSTMPLTLQVQQMDSGKKASRGLNPRFGLWLMGFPTTYFDGILLPTRKRGK